MTSRISHVEDELRRAPRIWVVTGAAGFIGSHLTRALLGMGQRVIGLDNLSTGNRANLADHPALTLIDGDIRNAEACGPAVEGADVVLHHAAVVSVPASIKDPGLTQAVNEQGFRNVANAARRAGAARIIYASSSAVYGDNAAIPAVEEKTGTPLSPYTASKARNEADAARLVGSGFEAVGLRYFNVFGSHQDVAGGYAAVIPAWIAACLRDEAPSVHGDGETTRDFCHVSNVVAANLLAATQPLAAPHRVFNVGLGGQITLNALLAEIQAVLQSDGLPTGKPARHTPFRPGDVRYSQADISRAVTELGYAPTTTLREGLREALPWFCRLSGVPG